MEFWGVEVKPNETLKCEPGDDKYLHLSQVSLGETKKDKGTDNITVFVKFNDQKLVLGTLSLDKFPQISYDLVFEKEFELSHSSKNTSLYFCGYKTATMDEHSDLSGSEFESDEDPIPLLSANGNSKKEELGKPATAKVATAKAATSAAKPKAKTEEPTNKADKRKAEAFVDEDDFDDEDDDEEDADEDDSDDEDMLDMAGDSDDEDDEDNSDEEDEDTPKKVESGKKRQPESASKTPAPAKKAKLVSPAGGQKTGGDGKKGGHTATPHPAKQVGKTPAASGDKSKQQTPKSAGSVACKSCSKTFNSENALQAHTKAKHSAAK